MGFNEFIGKLFGNKATRDMKEIKPWVDKIKAVYPEIAKLSNDELRAKTVELKKYISDSAAEEQKKIEELKGTIETTELEDREGIFAQIDKLEKEVLEKYEKALDDVLPQAFAIVKDTARRFSENPELIVTATDFDRELAAQGKDFVRIEDDKAIWQNHWIAGGNDMVWSMVHYDVQLFGGVVLHKGKIAEMATGEGKTLVATLPVFLNALTGNGVHVVTVNDYLSKRDSEWMGPLYQFHGLSVDCIDKHQPNSDARRRAYMADITFGTHNEIYRISNLFIQASEGAWYYNSLDLFMQDKPYQFTYKYSDPALTGGDLKYAPVMKAGQFGFYVQDKWIVSRNFNFTYGIRFDIPLLFNKPTVNPAFNTFAAERNMGVKVGETPSAKLMVSPRVGFSWYADDSHRTLFRGGVGIFTGRVPFVWLSNSFNNTGMEQKGTTIAPKDADKNYTNGAPTLTEYHENPKAAATTDAKQDIVTTSKNFKYPQVLRANLAYEQFLPGNVKMTLEGVYSKTMNNVFFENLALVENGQVYAVPGVEASTSPYYKAQAGDYYSIINLKNTNKGYSYALSALLEKHFGFGLDMSASYTFGHSKSVNDGTSSVAYSNWKYNYSHDTNSGNELSFSKFDIPHRIMVQAAYTTPKYWNNWMSTSISVIYNAFSGSRYSLTMNEKSDFNGDGFSGNSLLYIPTESELAKMNFVDEYDKNELVRTAEEGRQAFARWIENDDYAKNHRGQYAVRNSNLSNWEHEINLHLAQTIYNPKGLGKLEFTFDIINFANMLNKKWGVNYSSAYNLSPLTVASLTTDNNGQKTPTYYFNNAKITKNDTASRWHAQVGIRLTF